MIPYQLIKCHLGSLVIEHEPPGGSTHCSYAHINTNGQVTEEQPATNERVFVGTGQLLHDIDIRRVETKSSSREAICDQVDPEQLHRDQSLRETQRCCQENAVHMLNILEQNNQGTFTVKLIIS